MIYRDVFEFQQKYPTREEREKALEEMTYDEIMHLAKSCPSMEAPTMPKGPSRLHSGD